MAFTTHRTTSSTTVNTTYSSKSYASEHALPPTYNHLDAAQRSRYIRSSRKLGKVLGTTPLILESVPAIPLSVTMSLQTDTASKRCSAPPTPNAAYTSFNFSGSSPTAWNGDKGQGAGPSRGQSLSRTSSVSEKNSESSSNQPFFAGSEQSCGGHRYKSSTDDLGPLPVFSGPSAERRAGPQQPVMRLPLSGCANATPTSPLRESISLPRAAEPEQTGSGSASSSTHSLPPTSPVTPMRSDRPAVPPDPPRDDELSDAPDGEPERSAADEDDDDELETRRRKRRMDKLMRHLGERVPNELVFGPPRRGSASSTSKITPEPGASVLDPNAVASGYGAKLSNAQAKVMRRVSVMSPAGRRNRRARTYGDEADMPGSGYRSPTPDKYSGPQGAETLAEDEWSLEAYQNVVERLRRLK
ncbi:hypothetical protein DFH11DRAFT_844063 [Phellopilus nigrolimitatus]|nr:hypothetical protein DFH11DRAFT_844063 [Phellopilus nigrolimitatus]